METVVRYSKFVSDPYGDGGARRSRQIEESWKRDDTVFVDEKFPLGRTEAQGCPAFWLEKEILNLPEVIAAKKGIDIVACIDEFQQVGEFPDSSTSRAGI